MSRPIIKLGMLGLGTVGSSVVKVLQANASDIASRAGAELAIVKILVRDPDRPRPVQLPRDILTTNPEDILDNPEIQVVVELVGGLEPARGFILRALRNGKHVVTANKEVMAEYGKEIFHEAESHNCSVYFEASVGGGIPIIRALKESLGANRIRSILGIINGTTNYILTRMSHDGRDFAGALHEAREKGFAEADPSADIEGHDAARKLAILASIAFNARVQGHDVSVEGISRITPEDLEYARELGYVVKLLAIAKEEGGELEVRVHPTFIPLQHPLAYVNDQFNAIWVYGDAVGETMFYGHGAGGLPTASAVLGDLIAVTRNILHVEPGLNCTCFHQYPIKPLSEITSKFYVRLEVADQPGVLAQVAGILGNEGVSLYSVIQKRRRGDRAEIVFLTHEVKEKNLRTAMERIEQLACTHRITNIIHVEGGAA